MVRAWHAVSATMSSWIQHKLNSLHPPAMLAGSLALHPVLQRSWLSKVGMGCDVVEFLCISCCITMHVVAAVCWIAASPLAILKILVL